MKWVCKCGGMEFFTKEKGTHTGLYCTDCGKWQKWLNKDEVRFYNIKPSLTKEELIALIREKVSKVPTVKEPHTYMKAVGTKELNELIEEVFERG